MNWIQSMSRSIDYIETNITTDLSIKDISTIANSSPFYYQRMFMVLTNMSVQTYIRNRRLTLAAMELINSDTKIIDLAMKYGYETAESFSRAFKKAHHKSPSALRKSGSPINAFLKLSIKVTLEGELPMKYRIETKDAFKFYGISRRFTTIDGANFKEIPEFWQETMQDGSYDAMINMKENTTCIGSCMPMDKDDDTHFNYVIGAFCDEPIEGYDTHTVPTSEWAIFELKGPMSETLQSTWKRVFQEWFPQSDYRHTNLPEFEVYFGGDINSPDYYMELWIPIAK